MKRRALFLAAAASATLFAVFATACVRSNFQSDHTEGSLGRADPPDPYLSLISSGGVLTAAFSPQCPSRYEWEWKLAGPPSERRWLRAGFRFQRQSMRYPPLDSGIPAGTVQYYYAEVPYWSLLALTALLPTALLIARARRRRLTRRRERGLCARCGYDLRASPGRCPECGEPPAPLGSFPVL